MAEYTRGAFFYIMRTVFTAVMDQDQQAFDDVVTTQLAASLVGINALRAFAIDGDIIVSDIDPLYGVALVEDDGEGLAGVLCELFDCQEVFVVAPREIVRNGRFADDMSMERVQYVILKNDTLEYHGPISMAQVREIEALCKQSALRQIAAIELFLPVIRKLVNNGNIYGFTSELDKLDIAAMRRGLAVIDSPTIEPRDRTLEIVELLITLFAVTSKIGVPNRVAVLMDRLITS